MAGFGTSETCVDHVRTSARGGGNPDIEHTSSKDRIMNPKETTAVSNGPLVKVVSAPIKAFV
jgi:hypothetical protein